MYYYVLCIIMQYKCAFASFCINFKMMTIMTFDKESNIRCLNCPLAQLYRVAPIKIRRCRWIRLLSRHKSLASSTRMLWTLTWISFQDRIKWCWGEEERTKGKKHEGRRMKSRDGQGNERKGKDAGWQADGCPVYWFIRCFSHDVLSGHETSRRFSLCWKASYNEAHTRHTNALHIKTFTYYLFTL